MEKSSAVFVMCSVQSVSMPVYQSTPWDYENPPINLSLVTYITKSEHKTAHSQVYPEIHFFFGEKSVLWRFPRETKSEYQEDRFTRRGKVEDVPDYTKRDAEYDKIIARFAEAL